MTQYVIGISALYHDSAAALLRDGVIVAAAQEERFTRAKHDASFPANAIKYCLKEAGITIADVDYVGFHEKPMVKFERILETYRGVSPSGFESFREALPVWVNQKLHLPSIIRHELGESFRGQICFVDHHESHAASAYFPSPFRSAAILTLDAVGEWSTSSIGSGNDNRVELTHEMRFPHSLGMLYSAFTFYTGFKVNSGEYKLMGLAPYGNPIYAETILSEIIKLNDDGSLWMDMSYFGYCDGLVMTSEKFHSLFGGPPRLPDSDITQREMDLASSIQYVCEEAVLRCANHVHTITNEKNLVLAGGVALNCVANGRVLRDGPFDQIWIQPAAGDAGGALGAAFLIWHHLLKMHRNVVNTDSQLGSLLGPRFSNDEIRTFLDAAGARYEFINDDNQLVRTIANLLDESKVVGSFQGRMEYGPRALGSRSIIGDPRSREMQQVMNLKIKFRESFRPFAPCVLREFAHEIFEVRECEDAPYMLQVAQIRENLRIQLTEENARLMCDPDLRKRVAAPRSTLPAITHVDYSARIQTVDEQRHGRFYRIMRQFYEQTGCPVVVNTSFNIRGEPIVGTPEDAFRCFMATDMDCLVIENCVLRKEDQPTGLLESAERYRAQYELD